MGDFIYSCFMELPGKGFASWKATNEHLQRYTDINPPGIICFES